MADVYKVIHPMKFFTDYISRKTRTDAREFHDQRDIKLNIGSISNAESSAVVKCGNTSCVCGIKLELATPKAEEPDKGFLVINVELPSICNSKFKPGPPSDFAQVTSTLVSDIIANSNFVDLKDLCLAPGKLAWVVYCDIVCVDYDGSIVDAAIISLLASLKTLKLPTVTYDMETESIEVDPVHRQDLKCKGLPVATSFAIFKNKDSDVLLLDPDAYEEEMCGGCGANLIICCNKEKICATQKFGGSNLTTQCLDESVKLATKRVAVIKKVIEISLQKIEMEIKDKNGKE